MMKLKELLTTGVATAIAFGLTTGFLYGQGQSENPDDAPPAVGQERPDERPGDEGNALNEPDRNERGEGNAQRDRDRDRDVQIGTRDSLADQLVREEPDRDEIQKHLEEALIATGVGAEEAAEKSEELARKITDALDESNTEADEFDVEGESDRNRGTQRGTQRDAERGGAERGTGRDTEEDEEDDNEGPW